jgi:hypothetical protein
MKDLGKRKKGALKRLEEEIEDDPAFQEEFSKQPSPDIHSGFGMLASDKANELIKNVEDYMEESEGLIVEPELIPGKSFEPQLLDNILLGIAYIGQGRKEKANALRQSISDYSYKKKWLLTSSVPLMLFDALLGRKEFKYAFFAGDVRASTNAMACLYHIVKKDESDVIEMLENTVKTNEHQKPWITDREDKILVYGQSDKDSTECFFDNIMMATVHFAAGRHWQGLALHNYCLHVWPIEKYNGADFAHFDMYPSASDTLALAISMMAMNYAAPEANK